GLRPMMDTAGSISTTLRPTISFTLVQAFLFRISTTLASTQCSTTIPIRITRATTPPIRGISTTSPRARSLPCEGKLSGQLTKLNCCYSYSHTGGFYEQARIHAKNLARHFLSLSFASFVGKICFLPYSYPWVFIRAQ